MNHRIKSLNWQKQGAMKILLIEDDERFSLILVNAITKQNYIIDVVKNSEEALHFLKSTTYDLLLLDIVLPGIDGITFCRQLRSRGVNLPLLLLTARDDSTDKVKGLDAGADDYLVKPFNIEELFARIRALLRRRNTPIFPQLIWGNLCLIVGTNTVTYRDILLPLTAKEYALLDLFIRYPRRIFRADDLIQSVWDFEEPPTESTIRSHIRGLRNKLKAAGGSPNLIETVYGIGYRLNEKEEIPEVREDLSEVTPPLETEKLDKIKDKDEQILAALARSWAQFRASIFEDIDLLERAIDGAGEAIAETQKSPTRSLIPQAITTAHNLVGLLGSLSLSEAAKICREIERLLRRITKPNLKESSQICKLIKTLRQVLEESESIGGNRARLTSPKIERLYPLVLIIDRDLELTEDLYQLGNNWGLQIEVASSLSYGRQQIQKLHPDLIILEIHNDNEETLTLLNELNSMNPRIPVIILTTRGELSDRLEASKSDAVAFLRKPFSLEKVLIIINQVLQKSSSLSGTILIVDDDPKFISLVKNRLISQNLQIRTLSNPQEFWETLESVSPDLLILDLEMPNINGINLCKVVRNDPNWYDLPILFISAYMNQANITKIVAAGADDFLSKSDLNLELQPRVFSHLQRVQRLRKITEIRRGALVSANL
ncbi:response regulator [Limnofasciculus baicalensis]|uniref:Response regulator n=1 Tax=Limnofasciculus baicalensis BBK-W-15 TaxID=2699891 RepID=A0AAE3KQ87_9CYAN|nr:response regulator [Limnofasciculus baicalensis]MCP2727052.1 response regulator [Limnofasciculus baicalensis BBK-W-15]